MKKKVVIYPFLSNCYSIIEFFGALKDEYTVYKAIPPKGYFLDGKDIAHFDNRNNMNIFFDENIDDAIDECDVLFITDIENNNQLYKPVIDKIYTAMSRNKEIHCCMDLNEKDRIVFDRIAAENNLIFKSRDNRNFYKEVKQNNGILKSKMFESNVPVLFIGKTHYDLNSLELLLKTKNALESYDYQVCAISNCKYGEIINTISMPPFVFSENISGCKKVLLLNLFIEKLCEEYKPDIVLVELPAPIMKANNQFTNGFGIYPYIFAQAVQPDIFFLMVDCYEYAPEFYRNIKIKAEECYGCTIDLFAMTNRFFDYMDSQELEEYIFRYPPVNSIDEILKEYQDENLPVHNFFNNELKNSIIESIFNK